MRSASRAAVTVEHLWKRFRRGERHDSLRDLVPALARRIARGGRPSGELGEREFWAVSDVSFEVPPGQALGIVGPNGAGKSTMLKLLTRILRPTKGRCDVRGRIGAMIEVDAGFHPDLTGRENVFLQGAIMGMRRREIAAKLDEIVDFAGVSQFFDTPVKRYSSGMNARLGFSIAAHLDPDVLIIDEVLAVGDMAFQKKCIERMNAFKRRGVSIVFVSHNMQAVSELCDRAIFLKSAVQAEGRTGDVIAAYLASSAGRTARPVGGAVDILGARLTGPDGPVVGPISPGTPLALDVDCVANEPVSDLTFGVHVNRVTDGLKVYDGNVNGLEVGIESLEPGRRFTLHFAFRAHLTRGQYSVDAHVWHNPTSRFLASLEPAGLLTVAETRTFAGVADIELSCSA